MQPAPSARPVHAGGLPRWERLSFAVVLALLAGVVAAVAMSSAHGLAPAAAPQSPPRLLRPAAPGRPASGPGRAESVQALARKLPPESAADRRLAAAVAPVVRGQSGRLAVGIINRSTGTAAIYDGGLQVRAGSIARADILAAVLLQRERGPAALSRQDRDLAARMIVGRDNDAAARLWRLAGGSSGVAVANTRLGLRPGASGPAGSWRDAATAGSQLTLLADLTQAGSELTASARGYELGLLRSAAAGQRWGVSSAASAGLRPELMNGARRNSSLGTWQVSSAGAVHRDGQQLLLAVLCRDQPSRAAGIAAVEAAAIAAARWITSGRPAQRGSSG